MNSFKFKKVYVIYDMYIQYQKLKKETYRPSPKKSEHAQIVMYNGYGLYDALYKKNADFIGKADYWFVIKKLEIISESEIVYNYNPHEQRYFDSHILDRDDTLFDLIPEPMSENEGDFEPA